MSDREKKMLSLLLLAGFLILNFLLYSKYISKKAELSSKQKEAEINLQLALSSQANANQYAEQMEWLAKHEPAPTDDQTVKGDLQAFVANEASKQRLIIKPGREFQNTDTTGTYYHRAQFKISVTGTEQDVYRWLYNVNNPEAFRTATQIRVSPNTQDDTQIDCVAVIAQWFQVKPSDS